MTKNVKLRWLSVKRLFVRSTTALLLVIMCSITISSIAATVYQFCII